tara:strand:+ start:1659 stop:3332 length:1674 start_codon:yes stop_codon:yes gene_type:complete
VLPWALALVATALAVFFAWHDAGKDSGLESAAASSARHHFEAMTFDQQIVYNARFLPDGKSIVYSAARSGNRPAVFVLQPGAKAPQSVAPLGTHLLSVSSTGELAVLTETSYLYHRVHKGTLASMAIDGSPRALVQSVQDADWGPDGELAIVRRVAGMVRLEYPLGNVLYETVGYVSEPRVSADGSRVAFLDHQQDADDRGRVKLVNKNGAVETLTPEYQALEGLAWTPDGTRLLFSCADSIVHLQVQMHSTGLVAGDVRLELTAPGELLIVDVGADGRLAVLREELFYGVAARPPGGAAEVDLSWLDGSWGSTFAPDKQSLLFTTHRGGVNYTIVARRLDGSPIITLGEGNLCGASPDGLWVTGHLYDPPSIVIYPMGVGTSRQLERGDIESFHAAMWFPDSRSLLVTGNEAGRARRCYRQSIDGGLPEPVTPEGIFGALSPLGDRILVQEADSWKLYPLDGGEPEIAKGLTSADIPYWSEDGRSVHVHGIGEVPLRLERVDLKTGERTASLVIGPEREAGIVQLQLSAPIAEPGGGYCYAYKRRLSQLFVVDGDK